MYYTNYIMEILPKFIGLYQNITLKKLKLYEELKSKLETNLKELFLKYSDLYGERMDKALEDKYIQGFKIGLLIGIECNKIKF